MTFERLNPMTGEVASSAAAMQPEYELGSEEALIAGTCNEQPACHRQRVQCR